jgi:hypothetical protein
MKKILLLAIAFLSTGALFAQQGNPGNEKTHEISLNVFGLFVGNYTAQFEFVPVGDGLFSLGAKGTFENYKIGSVTLTGMQALAVARLYPAHYMQGFYIGLEAGYSSATFKDDTTSVSASSIPYMIGLGWKWLINDVSIDLGFANGKQSYLSAPSNSVVDFNSYPYNIAGDFYLLTGYRF